MDTYKFVAQAGTTARGRRNDKPLVVEVVDDVQKAEAYNVKHKRGRLTPRRTTPRYTRHLARERHTQRERDTHTERERERELSLIHI